ncbi:hypothetical protein ZIOFF_022260 [Zingiber officinale]|uniref:Uncharacterized protein n=1 Tax=Zingiber officinale TaxID=94328 RepID=A0A8J5LMM4_ZINOF|nr:hypothetical protein ZIOFF_022260 [Zingiber officinale]
MKPPAQGELIVRSLLVLDESSVTYKHADVDRRNCCEQLIGMMSGLGFQELYMIRASSTTSTKSTQSARDKGESIFLLLLANVVSRYKVAAYLQGLCSVNMTAVDG